MNVGNVVDALDKFINYCDMKEVVVLVSPGVARVVERVEENEDAVVLILREE